MKQGTLIFATLLLFAALFLPLVAYPSLSFLIYSESISTVGSIGYPPIPPPQPDGDYYQFWVDEKRVDSGFNNYFSGSTFNFTGFFDHLYAEFLQELETTVFGVGYQRPTLNYGSPTYSPGSAVGNLETVATYVVASETEITNALNSAVSEDIIFIKNGTYTFTSPPAVSSSNVIISGEGWGTVLKMANGVNQYVLRVSSGSQKIIIRDLTIDGNMANNPLTQGFAGLDIRGASDVLIENVQVLHVRQFGIDAWDSSKIYTINSVSIDSGWNTFEFTRSTFSAAIGNYFQDARDVSLSTWGSNNLVLANNVAVYGIRDGLGFNDANWGIGVEPQEGGNPIDTYSIIIRNNIASEHNQAGSDEPWKGSGIWITGSYGGIGGSYNIIIDGNIAENNNRAGIIITDDEKYPDGSSIVVSNNLARGNNRYSQTNSIYGDIVILREGVISHNNTVD